jgi:hypothetical protein
LVLLFGVYDRILVKMCIQFFRQSNFFNRLNWWTYWNKNVHIKMNLYCLLLVTAEIQSYIDDKNLCTYQFHAYFLFLLFHILVLIQWLLGWKYYVESCTRSGYLYWTSIDSHILNNGSLFIMGLFYLPLISNEVTI